MAGKLANRVAVVTGSSSGNGRAIAAAMVRPFLETGETDRLLHDLTPWPRLGTAEDVARAATFLASDDAEWMTGSMLTVDGAFTAR